MNRRQLQRLFRPALFISLAIALLTALPALAQASIWDLRATYIGTTSVKIKWENGSGSINYHINADSADGRRAHTGYTTETSYRIKGLRPDTSYKITVFHDHTTLEITVRTNEKQEQSRYTPPPVTCPHLPPSRAVVSGYAENTQCQMVGEVVIGKTDLIQHGFIDAVDVWSYVNGGLEVCFRNDGWLVFLDATYLQRMVMELEHYHRDGMTCGRIDRIGTVVLLASAPTTAPLAEPAETTLPIFDAIPLSDCLIKLVETLFLRAEPGGEIIGLVWLNSEVSAFEINGYWYKIEFEGTTGYISRFYRRVLRGGCG